MRSLLELKLLCCICWCLNYFLPCCLKKTELRKPTLWSSYTVFVVQYWVFNMGCQDDVEHIASEQESIKEKNMIKHRICKHCPLCIHFLLIVLNQQGKHTTSIICLVISALAKPVIPIPFYQLPLLRYQRLSCACTSYLTDVGRKRILECIAWSMRALGQHLNEHCLRIKIRWTSNTFWNFLNI